MGQIAWRVWFLLSAMQNRRQGLINKEAEHRIQQALKKGERQIEGQQAGQQAVHAGIDSLVHPDDGLQRQVVHDHIGRVNDEIVVRHADDGHNQRAQPCADESTSAGLAALVDKARHADEQRTHDEVEQLTDSGRAGAGQLDQVLDQADRDAGQRAVGIGRQQGGQFGYIQLDEGRHDGNGKFQVHQYGGDSTQHGGTSEFADIGCRVLHEIYLPKIV